MWQNQSSPKPNLVHFFIVNQNWYHLYLFVKITQKVTNISNILAYFCVKKGKYEGISVVFSSNCINSFTTNRFMFNLLNIGTLMMQDAMFVNK